MTTLTQKMLTKVEEWKAGYREIILASDRPEEVALEANQCTRLTLIENYLESRVDREVTCG